MIFIKDFFASMRNQLCVVYWQHFWFWNIGFKVSFADLIVLGGCAAVEAAAK